MITTKKVLFFVLEKQEIHIQMYFSNVFWNRQVIH